jgi:hypothetical protein
MKAAYAKSLAEEVLTGRLDLAALPPDDEEAIAAMTRVKGIGRWSAEIYLLFAEGRLDIWPAGDLAVQIEIGRILEPTRQAHGKGSARPCRALAPPSRRRGHLRLAPPACGADLARFVPLRGRAVHIDVHIDAADLVLDRATGRRSHVADAGGDVLDGTARFVRRVTDLLLVIFDRNLLVLPVAIHIA